LWGRWTEIVALFARQLPGRSRVDALSYRALHQELLAACRTMAAAGPNGDRAYFEDLGYLAQPWLTTWVLQQTDRAILLNLLQSCERARETLAARRFAALGRWLVWISVLTASALVTALLVVYLQGHWTTLLHGIDDHWRLFVLIARRLTNLEVILVTAGVMIVLAMVIVWRTGWRR
jgi:hypothetical protein